MAFLRLHLCCLLALFALAPAARTLRKSKGAAVKQPDQGDDFEYGDKESAVSQSDSSDFSAHQFLVNDDARETSPDSGNPQLEMARQKAAEADDHFNSEDTPDPQSFAQKAAQHTGADRASKQEPENVDDYEYGGKESEVTDSSAADFSAHQFLVRDDARDGPSDTANPSEEMARQRAAAQDDHFNSEDTPDPNAFVQKRSDSKKTIGKRDPGSDEEYEYGDKERQVSNMDSSDFSIHQFLATDDAREGNKDSENANVEMAKQKAEAADDHFNSEDTPDTDSFAQKSAQA